MTIRVQVVLHLQTLKARLALKVKFQEAEIEKGSESIVLHHLKVSKGLKRVIKEKIQEKKGEKEKKEEKNTESRTIQETGREDEKIQETGEEEMTHEIGGEGEVNHTKEEATQEMIEGDES